MGEKYIGVVGSEKVNQSFKETPATSLACSKHSSTAQKQVSALLALLHSALLADQELKVSTVLFIVMSGGHMSHSQQRRGNTRGMGPICLCQVERKLNVGTPPP